MAKSQKSLGMRKGTPRVRSGAQRQDEDGSRRETGGGRLAQEALAVTVFVHSGQ